MLSRNDRRATRMVGLVVGLLVLGNAAFVHAQGRVRVKTDQPDPNEVAKKMEEYEKGSQRRTIDTRDGVYLQVTYWRAKQPSTTTPIVVLLSMKGRTQRDWYPFAHELYEDGFAVLTFDFRGHGESTHIDPAKYKSPEYLAKEKEIRELQRKTGRRVVIPGTGKLQEPSKPRGDTITFADDFRSAKELGDMMVRDLEDVKRFLLELHNAREFNIQQLGIVGAEMSCNVLLNWMSEYEFQDGGRTGWTRQGGDVAAVVLITPSSNYEGYRAETKFTKEAQEVPMLLIANETRAKGDVARLARSLRVPELGTDAAKRRSSDFFRPDSGWMTVKSTLEGTLLFKPPVENINGTVHGYLAGRLKNTVGRIWKERKLDLDLGFGSGRVN